MRGRGENPQIAVAAKADTAIEKGLSRHGCLPCEIRNSAPAAVSLLARSSWAHRSVPCDCCEAVLDVVMFNCDSGGPIGWNEICALR
jgi:hypothetical protein